MRDYIFPCLRAGAVYERKYLLGTSMARPIIAKVNMLCRSSFGTCLHSRRFMLGVIELAVA